MKNYFILSLFVSIFFVSCSASHSVALQRILEHPHSYSSLDLIEGCPKQIIPLIIAHIKDTTISEVGFYDSLSSYIDPIYLRVAINRRGIVYAYLIDYYLSLPINNEKKIRELYPEFVGTIPGIEYYSHKLFDDAIIVKLDESGAPIEMQLSNDDLTLVYEQYRDWWQHNRRLPLKKLRGVYKKEGGILHYPFKWI